MNNTGFNTCIMLTHSAEWLFSIFVLFILQFHTIASLLMCTARNCTKKCGKKMSSLKLSP